MARSLHTLCLEQMPKILRGQWQFCLRHLAALFFASTDRPVVAWCAFPANPTPNSTLNTNEIHLTLGRRWTAEAGVHELHSELSSSLHPTGSTVFNSNASRGQKKGSDFDSEAFFSQSPLCPQNPQDNPSKRLPEDHDVQHLAMAWACRCSDQGLPR